jgi:hypothetical protein
MSQLDELQKRADESPEQAVTMGDLKAITVELKELGTWIESSNKVLNSRLIRLQRKCDSSYVFSSSESGLRQELAELQRQQKTMQQVVSKIQSRLR